MLPSQEDGEVLNYAPASAVPTSESPYAFASLFVAALAAAWLVLPMLGIALPFDAVKQYRIGGIASALAVILAIGAYRQPGRRRRAAIVALVVSAIIFIASVSLMPL